MSQRIKQYFGEEYGLNYISEPGRGSIVEVWLPLFRTREGWHRQVYKIMIVEDDVFYRYEIRNFIGLGGIWISGDRRGYEWEMCAGLPERRDTGSDSHRYQYAGDEWN